MNNTRRKKIAKAIELIEKAVEILEDVKNEEQEAIDNMPENLAGSERAEKMEEYIWNIDEYIEALDTGTLQEIIEG